MRQVLVYIPLHWLAQILPESLAQHIPDYLPLYGYGLMLFLAFILCGALANRLARREGVDPKFLPDLAIWLFVTGILGARITFILQEWPTFFGENRNPWRVFALWDGGLVLYGSIVGGAIGYILAHRRFLAPQGISFWKMTDIIAPCIALGVALGRIGCLCTGCCYGNVACAECAALTRPLTFPLPSAPTLDMARLGYQHLAGFQVRPETLEVIAIEPGSAADEQLRGGDIILKVNGMEVNADHLDPHLTRYELLQAALETAWPAPMRELHLTVLREGQEVELQPFVPESLPLHPTQVYETISMSLLLFFLLSYYPFKRRDGSVLVLLMLGYGLHRFLNEMLRVDNPPVVLNLFTFSQTVSLLVLAGAAVIAYLVFIRGVRETAPAIPAAGQW
jgi:phosphatidylglycerol:prolipoprotein diacylglycerol transferase